MINAFILIFLFLRSISIIHFNVLFILAPGLHGLGFIASAKDPLFMDLLIIRMQKCSRCLNRFHCNYNFHNVM
ncbi:VirB3 family type IV secretion system protein [Anaplasma phagocytophilum]|uniref:VirB3 family type IV secretion system protein n=1 Tax=Anaplasma phagocytophilum TaxID=948 RepID=UPI00201A57A5